MGVFAAGLVASGLAVDMPLFVLGRAVQGLGGGFISVSIYVVAGAAFDPRMRPALFGALSAAWVVPALVGPLLAGLLTSVTTWRLVFLGILPLVAAGLALVLPALRRLAVPAPGARPDPHRRWWALLSGVGVAALQYAGQRLDLLAVPIAVAGLVALVLGLGHLLPRGTARAARGLPTVVASRGLLAGAFFGVESLIPLSLSQLHGFTPTAAGVPLTAGAVGWSVASALQGRRPDLSRVRLLQAGFGFVVVGVGGTALVAVGALDGWPVYATWAVAGLGMGLGMSSVGVLLLEQSPSTAAGRTPPPCRSPTSRRPRCASVAWGCCSVRPPPGCCRSRPPSWPGSSAAPPSLRWAVRSPAGPGSRRPRRPRTRLRWLSHDVPRPRGDHADAPRGRRGDDRAAGPGGQRLLAARQRPRGPAHRRAVPRAARRRAGRPALGGAVHRRRHRERQPGREGHVLGPPGRRPPRTRVVVSPAEHHAVLDSVEWLVEHDGARVTWLDVDPTGAVTAEALAEALGDGTDVAVASVMWANNEIGAVSDLTAWPRWRTRWASRCTPTPCRPSARSRSTSPRAGSTR